MFVFAVALILLVGVRAEDHTHGGVEDFESERGQATAIVNAFNERFTNLFNSNQLDTLATELYLNNTQFSVNKKTFFGQDAIRDYHAIEKEHGIEHIQIVPLHNTMVGDLVYSMGRFVVSTVDQKIQHAFYSHILKKCEEGKYHVLAEFNTFTD